jgi:cytochrome c5
MKKIIAISLIVLAGCSASKMVTMTQADADKAAAKFPGATLASLQEGQKLYNDECGTCHALKATTWGNETEWKGIIPPMAEKAEINASQQNLITQYLLTYCKQ